MDGVREKDEKKEIDGESNLKTERETNKKREAERE